MKQSILYLDDEAGCVNVFYEAFHDDFDVRTATSAAEALRMLAEDAPDIVISDQKMPDMEGTEFLQRVAASYPESCRVMITGGRGRQRLARDQRRRHPSVHHEAVDRAGDEAGPDASGAVDRIAREREPGAELMPALRRFAPSGLGHAAQVFR